MALLPAVNRVQGRVSIRFLGINLVLSLLHGYRYIMAADEIQSMASMVFIHVALISTFIMLYLAVAALWLIAAAIMRSKTATYAMGVGLVSALHIFTFIDVSVYRIFKFHINRMVINLILTEDAGDVLHFGASMMTWFVAIIVVILAFEIGLILLLDRKTADQPLAGKTVAVVCVIALGLILTDKLVYAAADFFNRRDITRYGKLLPLYQPLTIKRFMRKYFQMEINRDEAIVFDNRRTSLHYPQQPLEREVLDRYPNILWIIPDAFRFDMLNEAVTPNIYRFAQQAKVFGRHYSGGNCTRFGVFSLFYGLSGTYWHRFLGENQGPVLIDALIELDYDIRIITSASCSNPEFRKTAFVKIPDKIIDDLGGSVVEKDIKVTETFIHWLDHRDTAQPFFGFLFYDAPHGPYAYPDAFDKYQPSERNPNYLTIGVKDAAAMKNSYQNALLFNDDEIGKVLRAIEDKGLLDSTIVLITGDHGEEFGEGGRMGHNSTFSDYQTRVPLVLYIPGQPPEHIEYITSHADVVPTFMQLLGYVSDPALYAHGQSLLTEPHRDYIVMASWGECAVFDGAHYICFSLESHNPGYFEIRDSRYQLVKNHSEVFQAKRRQVLSALAGFSSFYR